MPSHKMNICPVLARQVAHTQGEYNTSCTSIYFVAILNLYCWLLQIVFHTWLKEGS
jgi:hypothetical protein